ncbi:ABC transporter permease [Pseudoalteromonas umbrosa]|uniref:ABC transporter permease n=1 Tax=Pseudoalteromonas umbrosa TaxID=3048489 RepID=UPI0024C45621|nr:ABC transporter permease [Pseudoalteromonas sp. B95]MDK1288437.1 ABC transporter permease [Pseudoalteromonas sp. B95]
MSIFQKSILQGLSRIFKLPRLSIPLILTLGLTLGAVLSVVAISSTLLYKPLQGAPNEKSIQTLSYRFEMSKDMSVSYWDMRRLADLSEYFTDLGTWAGISPSDQDIIIEGTSYPTTRYDASHTILEVLGARLILGDDITMASPEKYVWLSETLWNQAFSSAKSALGKHITVNDQRYIVAGIIEDVLAVKSDDPILPQQIWFIQNLATTLIQSQEVGNVSNSMGSVLLQSANPQTRLPSQSQLDQWLVQYVKSSVDEKQAQGYLDLISGVKKEVIASDYRSNLLGDAKSLITALFFAVIGLLLMASLNLLNLFIAHYQGRTKEFAIQLSVGASLLRVRLLVFLENLPTFLLALVTGLLATAWALKSLPLIAGGSLPMIDVVQIDGITVATSCLIVVLLNGLFSTLALVDVDKASLINNLSSSGKGIQAQSNQWISKLLMIVQLSVASFLLTASVMLAIQSYQTVYRDLGFDLGNHYNISMYVADEQWAEQLGKNEDYQHSELKQLREQLAQLIENKVVNSEVVLPSFAPLSSAFIGRAFRSHENGGKRVVYQVKHLSSGFFNAFKIPMLAGSNLTQVQIDNDENRIVIDELMAKTVYPELSNQEVIGKTIQLSRDNSKPPMIINGIVPTTTSEAGQTNALIMPAVYSHRIDPDRTLRFTVSMPAGEVITAAMLSDEIAKQFPRLTNLEVNSLEQVWDEQTLNQRISLWVVLSLTGLTLVLAAIGIAGLTQMTTNHRKYELAVRMATGAMQIKLVQFILKDALLMLVIGLGLGFVVSAIGYQAMQNQLLLLPDFNLVAMALLNVGLITVVITSVALPAWKVISSDPMGALRQE